MHTKEHVIVHVLQNPLPVNSVSHKYTAYTTQGLCHTISMFTGLCKRGSRPTLTRREVNMTASCEF